MLNVEKQSEFKDWRDDVFAALQMECIKEYVLDAWKDKATHANVYAETSTYDGHNAGAANDLKQKAFIKETKKKNHTWLDY